MSNKTILISGGTTGIGAATALKFLQGGWNVAAFNNRAADNKKFLKNSLVAKYKKRLLVITADITKEAELKKVVAETVSKFKSVDVLFNNAGLGYFTAADKMDVKKFNKMMEVNVIGMADLTKLVLPLMKKQGGGQIINNASTAAKVGHAKSEFYAATKSAIMRYSEGLRAEVANSGIKVSVIYTSNVKTEFWDAKEVARRKKEVWKGKPPVFLQPQDIANSIYIIANQPSHSVIEELTIMPFGN